MVKAVTLAFCSIWQHFIRDICAKFGIPNLLQSPDIKQNLDGDISNFRISGQSLIKVNCDNSRTSDDIHRKLGPVTKLDKRSKITSKKFDDDVMSTNFDVIVIFLIFGQFGAIRKTDSRCIVCKIYIFINSNINSNLEKSENRTKKSLAQRLHIALSRGQKILFFLEKHADISKIKKAYVCVLTYQSSSF